MNTVEQIVRGIPDAELKEAVAEMKALDETGVLPNGHVRALAHRLQHEAGLLADDARKVAHASVLRIAAFRWAGFN